MDPNKSYTSKYQKQVACSFDISNPFNSYVCENVVHNFINSMTEGSKYLKKNFKKELVMTEKDNSDFNVRKTGGGGVSLIPPVVFPKMYLVKSR